MSDGLLKLSFAIAILGTLAIIFLSNNLEPKAIEISSINEKMLDEWVKVSGKVVYSQNTNSLNIFTISDSTASINCIFRGNENVSENSVVEVLGKLTEYEGELEIDVSRIKNAA